MLVSYIFLFYCAHTTVSMLLYERPWMFNRAKDLDPTTLTFVNDYNIITWTPGEVANYKSQITDLINAGATIDGIGVQGHFSNGVDPLSVKLQLDSLATLGLPIVISEYDSDTADVQARADDLEALYCIGFSHPAVEGVSSVLCYAVHISRTR